jgi:hypothetical protein
VITVTKQVYAITVQTDDKTVSIAAPGPQGPVGSAGTADGIFKAGAFVSIDGFGAMTISSNVGFGAQIDIHGDTTLDGNFNVANGGISVDSNIIATRNGGHFVVDNGYILFTPWQNGFNLAGDAAGPWIGYDETDTVIHVVWPDSTVDDLIRGDGALLVRGTTEPNADARGPLLFHSGDEIMAKLPGGGKIKLTSYKHVQNSGATVWTINHNMGWRPNVSAFDTLGREIVGDVHHVSDNQLTLTFSVTLAGEAYLS